jgi:hypothetical protein
MRFPRKRGATSVKARIFIPDNSVTTGAGLSSLTFASTNLAICYSRENDNGGTEVTGANLLTITTIGTWADPGAGKLRFAPVDATKLPGLYEIHFPDAAAFGVGDTSQNIVVNVYEKTTTALKIGPNMVLIPLSVVNVLDGEANTIQVAGTAQTAIDIGTTLGIAGAGLTALGDTRLALLNALALNRTTIATLTSQRVFTLTAASADADAYKGCIAVIEDATTATQKAVGVISAYAMTTKQITLASNPAIFTMAVGDTVTILPFTAADVIKVAGTTQTARDLGLALPAVAPGTADGLPTVAGDNTVAQPVNVTGYSSSDGLTYVYLYFGTIPAGAGGNTTITPGGVGWTSTVGMLLFCGNNNDSYRIIAAPTDLTITLDKAMNVANEGGYYVLLPDADALLTTHALADVNAEVDTALADIHLDHLLAADYDPATKPGVATALLNEIIGSDAGVSQFTANALELAPTGGTALTAQEVRDAMKLAPTALPAPSAGSVDKHLDDIALYGGGSGTGSYTDTITDGANPLDGVRVQLSTDSAGSNRVYEAWTIATGVFVMNPDPGTYYRWLDLAGYTFTQGVSVVVP